jgi:arabinose-5-phosphate isomerase
VPVFDAPPRDRCNANTGHQHQSLLSFPPHSVLKYLHFNYTNALRSVTVELSGHANHLPNRRLSSIVRACFMDYVKRAKDVFDIEIDALRRTRARLDEQFCAVVDLIVKTLQNKGKLIVIGVGKSGNVGQKIAATLTSTGTTSVVLNAADALHGDLGVVNDGDVVLALSYSGETEELVRILPAIKRFDVKILAMTGYPKSSIARHSDLVLNVSIKKEACPFNLAPTSSTTAMLALGDALALCVLDARGFKKSDYAKRHPAGSIGRTMLMQIKDIMRTGDRNAMIEQSRSVQDALLAMTKAKSGTISVVDSRGRVAGVFTDGDFRRQISSDRAVLDAPVRSVMTRNPITIRASALAVEALKIFEQRQIDDLIVVDDQKRPVGVVDSQDLPKLKIM